MESMVEQLAELEMGSPLPDGWRWKKIGEVCQVNPSISKPEGFLDTTEISFIPMSAIDEETGTIASPEKRSLSEIWKGYKRFQNGDVIFARITPCMENGKAALARDLVNGIACGSTEFHVLRANLNEITPQWLYYFVRQKNFRDEAAANFSGTAGQLRVPAGFLEEKFIPVPPISEQERIVSRIENLLQQVGVTRTALYRIPPLLKAFRQSVLAAAFRGELTERDPDDEPTEVLLEHIRPERRHKWEVNLHIKGKEPANTTYEEPAAPDTSNLPELPEGWVWTTVDELCYVGTGATPLRGTKKYWDNGSIPWVTSGALNDPYIYHADELITESALRETNTKVFPQGTLLVAMYGEGRTRGLVSELKINAATNQACAALVFEGEAANCKNFVKLLFEKIYEDIRMLSSGGVQPNLNLSIIRRTPIPLPSLGEQERIVKYIQSITMQSERIGDAMRTASKRMDELEQASLSKAFQGEL